MGNDLSPVISRRTLIQAASGCAAATVGLGAASQLDAATAVSDASNTVRDRLWIWTHPAGSHNAFIAPRTSRMTPMEGAAYLNVPNAMIIRYDDIPAIEDFDKYAIAFRPLKRVAWSLTGRSGITSTEEQDAVIELPKRYDNIDRFILDDFKYPAEGPLSPQGLADLRPKLMINGKQRDIWVVVYSRDNFDRTLPHLKVVDGITFWTQNPDEIDLLEKRFSKLEEDAPKPRKLLGCYMFHYGERKEIPLDRMKQQCEIGLDWLKRGRIEGMIFLANNICDQNFEAVEWTQEWIARHGDERIEVK